MSRDRLVAVTGANGYIGSHVVRYYWNVASELGWGSIAPHRRAGSTLQEMPIAKGGSLEVLATDVLDSVT